MRVTTDDISPDFVFHIFLDGKEVINCVMADDEKGEVEIYEMFDGHFVLDGDEIKKVTLTGDVVIEKRYKKCG